MCAAEQGRLRPIGDPEPANRVVLDTIRSTVDGMARDWARYTRYSDWRAGLPHASAHLAYVVDTNTQARDRLCASMPGWLATTAEYPTPRPHDGSGSRPAWVRAAPAGPPPGRPTGVCVRRLTDSVRATGVCRLLLMVEGAGDPALMFANIARLGREVLPLLRRSAG